MRTNSGNEEIRKKIYSELRKKIIKNELCRGQRLVETKIADEYGVNKIHVRDVLETLTNDRLAEYQPRKGFYVLGISREDLLEFAKIRELLESALFEDILANASDEDINTAIVLTKRKVALLRAGLREEAVKETWAFFEKLYECTSYSHIVDILRKYQEYIDLMVNQSFEFPEDISKAIVNSVFLCEVLEKRDYELAKKFLHIRYENIVNKVNSSSKYYDKMG